MKTFAMVAFILVTLPVSHGQNLVPNPSFEEFEECPWMPGFGSKPLHWDRWDQSPDYFHECAGSLGGVDTLLGVPWNGFTWQHAFDGQAYVGGATYTVNDFHELIGAELLAPLTTGETYYASFHTNLAMNGSYWEVRWASNNVGLLFTMEEHIWSGKTGSGPEFIPRNHAHINASEVITDTAGWTLVSGSFVADSAYRYVVIGNFFEDALTDTMHVEEGPSGGAYYLYDKVCVSPLPGQCVLATGVGANSLDAVHVFPNPASTYVNVRGVVLGARVRVLDGSGRSCVDQYCVQDCMVAVHDLLPGTYVLVVEEVGGRRSHSKLVLR